MLPFCPRTSAEVIFVFLQSFRASFIPLIAVPVVLLGTFAVLLIMGMSINTLTMFAMVLANGLLVDDAIVVVECADAQALPYIGDPSKNSLMTNIPMYDAAGNELGKNWCVQSCAGAA